MTGLLAAQRVLALEHPLEDVAVAHRGLLDADALLLHRQAQAQVRHDGHDQGVVRQRPLLLHAQRQDAHDLVAVDLAAQRVNRQAAVRVAIEGDAQIRLVLDDGLAEVLDVGGAHPVVDVVAVRLRGDDDDLGTRLPQCGRTHDRGRPVCAVDDDGQPGQGPLRAGLAQAAHQVLRELVRGGRVAADAAHLRARGALPLLVQEREDLVLLRVGELRAAGAEELDAVVRHGVVRGGDDDSEGRTARLDRVRDPRGGQHAHIVDVDAGRGDPGGGRGREELAAHPGVPADDRDRTDAGLGGLRASQHAAPGDGQLQREPRGDIAVGQASDAVGTEES